MHVKVHVYREDNPIVVVKNIANKPTMFLYEVKDGHSRCFRQGRV